MGRPKIELCMKVQKFAEAMQEKLWENRHKGGWKNCTPEYLEIRLREETEELISCDDEDFLDEAADAANFIMMMCDNKGLLTDV